jgi:PAS domain S-box-containing protein
MFRIFARLGAALDLSPAPRVPAFVRWALVPLVVATAFAVQRAVLPTPGIAPFVFFYLAVAVAAWLGGRGPGLAAVAASAGVVSWYFLEPRGAFALHDEGLRATALFLVGSSPVALLCASLRGAVVRAEQASDVVRQQADLLKQSYDAVFVWRVDGAIESWSPGAEALYGFRADEAIGRVSHELLQTRFPVTLARVEAVLAERGRWEGQLVHRTKDGRMLTVDSRFTVARGKDGVERVLETVRDATDRERREADIRALYGELERRAAEVDAERRRWQSVVEGIADEVWVVDERGVVTYVRASGADPRRYAKLEGQSVRDAVTTLDLRLLGGSRRSPDDAPLLRSLRGETLRGEELFVDPCTGRESFREYSSAPVRDATGGIVGAVAIVRDVTAHKRLEAALREADQRKDEFLAVLSHELRNPLAPIRSSLHVLDHAAPDSERARRARAIIGHQVAHMTRLVGDLLDVGRIRRGKVDLVRGPVDLVAVVERTVEDHRAVFAARGVRFTSRVSVPSAWVRGDADRLVQVLGNLLHNAAKFTPSAGRVDVELDREAELAVVRVRDTGAGIPEDALAAIFEPFTQGPQGLDRAAGGLGLGLTLAKGLIELHGGDIRAESAGPGRGAEVSFRIPLDATATRVEPAPVSPVRAEGVRVLVVEDNVDAAESLRDALELDSHEVSVAHDGATAVAAARTTKPEVVLCDIGLPGMDGYEVARAIRADLGATGVTLVALTGYAGAEDRRRALDAGFDRHIAKPPDLEELERILAEAPRRAA